MIATPRQFTQRAEFYHQLAQLTAAGIGFVPAVEQLQRNPPSAAFREPLQCFLDGLADGRPVAESLRATGWLPDFDLALIEAGERSGRLDACFRLLADYYNDRASVAKQIISQLIYPAFLIHFAVLIFLIVLPFAASQFSASLPWLFAKAVLFLSPIYLVTALAIYAGQSRHGESWRASLENLLHPVPLLGSGRRALALARLALALEALISAGVNIIEAWDIAAAASGSPALRRAVASWQPQFTAGRTPAELVHATPVFPETFANLYHSGEISGKLDETLRRLHAFYQEDGAHKLRLVAQWLPRAIYFLVVLFIAYFIIQFFNQLYGSNSTLSHVINGF